MRWIRWQYVLPRLVAIIVAVVAIEFGAGTLVQTVFVQTGQSVVGARVDAGDAQASLLNTNVGVDDIRVANPRRPLENLLEADRLELDFETGALLRKKAVARHAVLRGVRFNTPRESSGQLPGVDLVDVGTFDFGRGDQAAALARQWFDNLGRHFQQEVVDQLESVRVAEELVEGWPKKYANLERDIQALKERAQQLQAHVQAAQANPLRNAEFLENLPKQLQSLKQSAQSLNQQLEALPEAVETDRRKILAARRHDEQLLREKLKIDAIDSAAMTAYLLQDRVAGPVADLIGWLRWARTVVPVAMIEPEPSRQRGTDVQFAGCRQWPNFLIRSLDLEGTARIVGQPVELAGTLTDMTNDPAVHGKPMQLVLTTSGSLPLELRATVDRTGQVPRDELRVDCHRILLPQVCLGIPGRFGLTLAPSTGTVKMSVLLEGERLTGNVQLIQNAVQITPAVTGEAIASELEAAVKPSLRKLNSLATTVTLSGTLDAPDWQVSSNLGPAVAEAVESAVKGAVATKTDELLARSGGRIAEQLAGLERLVVQRQLELESQLDAPSAQLKQLVEDFVGGRGLSLDQLGRRLPANSLFRR